MRSSLKRLSIILGLAGISSAGCGSSTSYEGPLFDSDGSVMADGGPDATSDQGGNSTTDATTGGSDAVGGNDAAVDSPPPPGDSSLGGNDASDAIGADTTVSSDATGDAVPSMDVAGDGASADTGGDVSAASDTGTDAMSTSDGAADAAAGSDGGDASAGCTQDQACFTGNNVTKRNVGACHDGIRYCVNGTLGPCTGEVLPSVESCNGADDDCNGVSDDGLGNVVCGVGSCLRTVAACANGKPQTCTAGTPTAETCGMPALDENCNGIANEGCTCIYVGPQCSGAACVPPADTPTCGSTGAPCKTIQYALTRADAAKPTVCVAATNGCSTGGATTPYNEAITMLNGIAVLGGYDLTTQARSANCVTGIVAQNATGVLFDTSITSPTLIDGFTISQARATDPISAAVTIQGSQSSTPGGFSAIVANNIINGGGATTESYGVRIIDSNGIPSTPLLKGNAITGGVGPTSIGVGSTKSQPSIQNHCSSVNAAAHCAVSGCGGTSFIRGRGTVGAASWVSSYGVRLIDSPNAYISINAIAGDCASGSPPAPTGDSAAVRISGDATNTTVRASFLQNFRGGALASGLLLDACAGASPWIFDNERISGSSSIVGSKGDGIRSTGDCHPRIDSNVLIIGGQEGANTDSNGVYCAKDATGTSSRCEILNNGLTPTPTTAVPGVLGSTSGFPPNSAAIRCDDGSCARIDNNKIDARAGIRTFGIVLGNTGTFVNRNIIDAGCPTQEGVGIEAINSFARIQNNIVRGVGNCIGVATPSSWALRVTNVAGGNEIDVHSNDLLAQGSSTLPTCRAIGINASPNTPPLGIYRNNILHVGFCATAYGVEETSVAADPRIFEYNDVFTAGNAFNFFLYRDEAATNITTLVALNTAVGQTTNIIDDPLFVAPSPYSFNLTAPNYHLQVTPTVSKCINAGTSNGVIPPPNFTDLFGTVRPLTTGYDIGAVEQQ